MTRTLSDAILLASARRALSEAAPRGPSPALLASIRLEAARRRAAARRARFLRRLLLAPLAAAAAAALAFRLLPPGADPRATAASEPPAQEAVAQADAALQLLLLDAAGEESSDGLPADGESLSFSDALLAWQEAPLADLSDDLTLVF